MLYGPTEIVRPWWQHVLLFFAGGFGLLWGLGLGGGVLFVVYKLLRWLL